ncbi:MAG: elongation factor G [Spirochaetia bacterium]
MAITSDAIRNIAFAGHGSTGKTTLVEQILFNGGQIAKPETVASGKTVSDYHEEEVERGISVHASLSYVNWEEKLVNMLDTPGSSDFVGEVVAAFRSAESAVVVLGGKAGVQIETIKVWRRLNQRNMPRIAFINKMDEDRADYSTVLSDLSEKFDATFVPICVPFGNGADFKGVVDLIEQKAYLAPGFGTKEKETEITDEIQAIIDEYKPILDESAAEGVEELVEKYLEEGELSAEDIKTGLLTGFKNNTLVPVLCGAAEQGSGITPLMHFVANDGPAPLGQQEPAEKDDGEEISVKIDPEGDLAALVFKTSIDQFSGKLSFTKVISGKLHTDMEVFNARSDKKEKISKIYRAVGKKLEDVKELVAGDIGILAKMAVAETNDTLCAEDCTFHMKSLKLPQPVHSVAISATSKKDEDKLNQMLQRAAEEDLTFTIDFNKETKETVISGMGELHLNMILDKIRDHQKIEMETKVPKIPYRETITKPSGAEYTHKKQSGGHGQFGRVVLNIEPLQRGEQFDFVNAIHGGSISKGYIPGVEKGVLEAMDEGVVAGYPVVDVRSTVVDGKEHPVDSSEMAFKIAARGAFRDAMQKAGAVLLEPVMDLEVFIDDQYLGDVLSDLSSKRGRVLGQENMGGGIQEVKAQVPQAELQRYSIDLRSITSGTGSFEAEFSHYAPISGKIAEEVIAKAKAEAEKED